MTSTTDHDIRATRASAAPDPAPTPAPDQGPDLVERVRADGAEFVLALFVDLAGRPSGKLIPAEAVGQLQREGAGFAGYAAGLTGQTPGDPDLVAMPDAASYTPIPFIRPGLALVHCDPHVDGKPWPYAPRVILKEVVRRAAQGELTFNVGAEVEYFLLKQDEHGAITPADPRDDTVRPCYDVRGVTRMYDHVTAVSKAMNALGWGNYANNHEDANGQFEQNFDYADALTTADRIITLRYLVSTLAERAGMIATFMPKPFADRTGNGMHLHLSLWRGAQPAFPDPGDPRGLSLSPLAYSFIAGVIEHAQGLQAVIAPTVNSYKRSSALTTVSGATWSPRSAGYGGNDRTHYIRVPDGDRIELRGTDGSANPYLAAATVLAAGLDGIARRLDPGDPDSEIKTPAQAQTQGRRPVLPPTLLHAVESLVADRLVCAALDAAGSGVSAYYAELKRAEFFVWHGAVSPWEIDRYLTAL